MNKVYIVYWDTEDGICIDKVFANEQSAKELIEKYKNNGRNTSILYYNCYDVI